MHTHRNLPGKHNYTRRSDRRFHCSDSFAHNLVRMNTRKQLHHKPYRQDNFHRSP